MKRYIRMENGIYERNNLPAYKNEADTIEELCDNFVVDYKNGSHTFYQDFGDTNLLYNGNQDLFGAIWTDKGLIYVAKMNDRGELELI